MMSLLSKLGLLAIVSASVSSVSLVQASSPSSGNDCNVSGNLVQNCGFDQGLSGYVLGGAGNQVVQVADLHDTGFTQTYGPSALLGSTNFRDDTLTQSLPLQSLKSYKISFDFGLFITGDTTVHGAVIFDGHTLFNFQSGVETTPLPSGNQAFQSPLTYYHRDYVYQIVDLQSAHLTIVIAGQSQPAWFVIDNIAVVEIATAASSTASTPVTVAPSSTGPAASTATGQPGAVGDPQFTGFLGQSYQVHGSADNVYNVISSRHLQYNALFKYLDHGKCRAGTECFAHPGNYFGQVGVLIKSDSAEPSSFGYHSKKFIDARAGGGSTKEGHDDEQQISSSSDAGHKHGDHQDYQLTITAGSVDAGMTVQMGNVTLTPSNKRIQLTEQSGLFFPSKFEFYIETVDFTIKLENSDMFLNQGVSINDLLVKDIKSYQADKKSSSVTSADLPHGILGQTWEMKSYDNKWKYIQGTLNEYIVADGIMGADFKYNRFE